MLVLEAKLLFVRLARRTHELFGIWPVAWQPCAGLGYHKKASHDLYLDAKDETEYGWRHMTAILGISAFYHDSAAALMRNGQLIGAVQEERFTRIKHDSAFPTQAIKYCLKEGEILAGDVEYVAFYDKPLTKFERLLETYLAFAPSGFRSFKMAMPPWLKNKLHMRRTLRRGLDGQSRARLIFIDHHESHAAQRVFPKSV